MKTFKEKNILITGASSGLGKALSIHFDKKVNSLICVGKNSNKIKFLKRKLKNKNNKYFFGDLSNDEKLRKFLDFINKIKNINTIIHCMGGGLGLKDDLIKQKDFLKP